MGFLKDIFTEDKIDNKYSSKRTLGVLSGFLACVSFVVDGLHFYTINESLFDSLLIYSGAMLGVSVLKSFATKNKKE
jgi:hypothetical protein|tara:strand:+ start:75 stop:305 length:231 start_codon:yes stop_codon:yes gene_type:complete